MTQWKSLKGIVEFGDYYEISDTGLLKNVKTRKILKCSDNGHGYLQARLMKDKKGKNYKIHRLVALSFIPNPEAKPMVNHKDGNQRNNAAYNLEWATNQENIKHGFDIGLINAKLGEDSNNSKLSSEKVVMIKKLLMDGKPAKKIANMFGVDYQAVRSIHLGGTWSHVQVEGFIPSKRGTMKKIAPKTVIEIRKLYATGEFSQPALAKQFGVSSKAIYRIVNNLVHRDLVIE